MQRTARLRQSGDKPNGGQPGHEGQSLSAADTPDRTETHEADTCAHCQASLTGTEAVGYEEESREMLGVMPLPGSLPPQGPCLDTSA